MKIKITPLLVIAILMLLAGIIDIATGGGGNMGPVAGIALIMALPFCLVPYVIIGLLFKNKIKSRVIAEVLLILVAWFA